MIFGMNIKVRIGIIAGIFLFLALVTFLINYFGGKYAGYSSNFISICAFAVAFWKAFLEKPRELKKEIHVSPQKLMGFTYNPLTLHVIVQNKGETNVNMRFAYLDIFGGPRLEVSTLKDWNDNNINRDVTIPPTESKDLKIVFATKVIEWEKIQKVLNEAVEKRDTRILGELSQKTGRLIWHDASENKAQETQVLIGVLLKDIADEEIKNSVGLGPIFH